MEQEMYAILKADRLKGSSMRKQKARQTDRLRWNGGDEHPRGLSKSSRQDALPNVASEPKGTLIALL